MDLVLACLIIALVFIVWRFVVFHSKEFNKKPINYSMDNPLCINEPSSELIETLNKELEEEQVKKHNENVMNKQQLERMRIEKEEREKKAIIELQRNSFNEILMSSKETQRLYQCLSEGRNLDEEYIFFNPNDEKTKKVTVQEIVAHTTLLLADLKLFRFHSLKKDNVGILYHLHNYQRILDIKFEYKDLVYMGLGFRTTVKIECVGEFIFDIELDCFKYFDFIEREEVILEFYSDNEYDNYSFNAMLGVLDGIESIKENIWEHYKKEKRMSEFKKSDLGIQNKNLDWEIQNL